MDENRLTVSQLRHANSVLQARLRMMETQKQHIKKLAAQQADHEERLCATTEGMTQFKIISGLASGSSSLMSLVVIIKAFLGG